MNWIPRFSYGSATMVGLPDRDEDAEGWYFTGQQLGILVQITIAKEKN